MKLTFWGAAGQVTGSMFLLETDDDYRILVDCGFDMERERSPEDPIDAHPSRLFPFEASMVNTVILTHAHIDHSGNIPNLIREGFEGQIVCTSPTMTLTELLLEDSAAIHERKWKKYRRQKNRQPFSKNGITLPKEWFVKKHVNWAKEQFFPIQFNRRFQLAEGVHVTLLPAGHLLGAAHVLLEVVERGEKKTILFSGDLGRYNYPLLPDPAIPPQVDYLICESTYGDKQRSSVGEPEEILLDIVKEACVSKAGKLIIPAFSVGRTQALLFTLNKLYIKKKLPPIKVFSDSPLAHSSTRAYMKYVNMLNDEAQAFYEEHRALFDFENLVYVEKLKQSKALAYFNEPCIIISSSGMVQGGRIEHHVRANIQNPQSTILMVGYAAEGTLGHELLSGAKTITAHKEKEEVEVLANIESIDVFSGHGDQKDLLHFVSHQDPERLKKIFLVHGELSSMQTFKQLLHERRFRDVEIPMRGQTFEL